MPQVFKIHKIELSIDKENDIMRKPMIGIVPLLDVEKDSYWMLPGYMKGIEAVGGLPVMLPLTEDEEEIRQLLELCGGILFTGGQDVSPELYREEKLPECGECSRERDRMETLLLKQVLEKDIPAFGICRGIQFINACLGGTLYQDLPAQKPSGTEHHQKPPYDQPVHKVIISQGSPLQQLLKKETLAVNSYHHQAVKKTAPGLSVMALSEDGIVEAVFMPGKKFLWAVQWHPEFSFFNDQDSRKILKAFVEAAKG